MVQVLRIAILFLLSVSLVTCGAEHRYKKYRKHNTTPASKYLHDLDIEIDAKITSIFNQWRSEAIQHNTSPDWHNVKFILFSENLKSLAGIQIDGEGIFINENYRDSKLLKVIVYHELGHGMFYLDHDSSSANIMSPYFSDFIGMVYLTNWDRYKEDYWNKIIQEENK